jgi:sulfur-oxidizing protein SoxY
MKPETRRSFIARLMAIAALPFGAARAAQPQSEPSAQELLRALTAGAALQRGRVRIEMPKLADNGNSVALNVDVDSPMTESQFVKSIHLFAEKNPRPNVANFYLGPRAGRAQISTRIRLAGTQDVLAVAALSDGSFWAGSTEVVVTATACTDDS